MTHQFTVVKGSPLLLPWKLNDIILDLTWMSLDALLWEHVLFLIDALDVFFLMWAYLFDTDLQAQDNMINPHR